MTLDPGVVEAFRRATAILRRLPSLYAAIGGLARNAWGTPRATTDLDFALVLNGVAELDTATRELGAAGFLLERTSGPSDPADAVPDVVFLRAGAPDGVRLDLLLAKTPFEIEAVGRAGESTVLGEPCRVITPEDLVVYKLVAFRPRDRLDIEDVLDVQRRRRAIDLAHIDRWAAEWGVVDRWLPFRASLGPAGR